MRAWAYENFNLNLLNCSYMTMKSSCLPAVEKLQKSITTM